MRHLRRQAGLNGDGLFTAVVHDCKLMREAQVNIPIRWFLGYGLREKLPHHSSLSRIRQRWGEEIKAITMGDFFSEPRARR